MNADFSDPMDFHPVHPLDLRPNLETENLKLPALGLPEAIRGVGLAAAPVVQVSREHEDRRVAVAEEGV